MRKFPLNPDSSCKFFRLDPKEVISMICDVRFDEFTPLIQVAERFILALARAGYVDIEDQEVKGD